MYGCDWASEDDMLNASKMANVHDFVNDLDMQYDTNCGEKGVQLSGKIYILKKIFFASFVFFLCNIFYFFSHVFFFS